MERQRTSTVTSLASSATISSRGYTAPFAATPVASRVTDTGPAKAWLRGA